MLRIPKSLLYLSDTSFKIHSNLFCIVGCETRDLSKMIVKWNRLETLKPAVPGIVEIPDTEEEYQKHNAPEEELNYRKNSERTDLPRVTPGLVTDRQLSVTRSHLVSVYWCNFPVIVILFVTQYLETNLLILPYVVSILTRHANFSVHVFHLESLILG